MYAPSRMPGDGHLHVNVRARKISSLCARVCGKEEKEEKEEEEKVLWELRGTRAFYNLCPRLLSHATKEKDSGRLHVFSRSKNVDIR